MIVDESLESQGYLAYVDRQIHNRPQATAMRCGEQSFDYATTGTLVTQLASALAARGVKAGAKVAIAVNRSEYLVPLLLAVWSLRAAYVPVDPSYPAQRQNYILYNAEAEILVAEGPREDLTFSGALVGLQDLLDRSAGATPRLAAADYRPDDLAYLIYTSGSTGNPKGVAVTQGNLINFLLAMAVEPGLGRDDKLLAITTISFDIHVLECFLPLLVGAELIVATKEQATDQQSLQSLIDRHAITLLQATPATWRMLLGQGWQPQRPLKILVGGEALPQDLRPLMHSASSELWNMYGPTETTVWSTCQKILPADTKILIGAPIRQTSVFIVDEQLIPLPCGVAGELLIGGAGVAQGYYGRADLTDERFLRLPELSPGRLYRTGDAVIRHPDGRLEYVNRIDNQIKVRGFRIEPSEIERALEQHSGVRQAVVVAVEFAAGDKRIVAFYLGQPQPPQELLQSCRARLPAHMVPQHMVHLEQMPMTANYKVDRKALVAMAPLSVARQTQPDQDAARDDLDRSLITVWERALNLRGIGLDDNFFDLGGDSLSALKVLAEMERCSGLHFASTAIFETPTLRALRDSLGERAERAASVVPLNFATEGEPVFCLCGVKIYKELADQFAESRPVFGVFAKQEFAIIQADRDNEIHYSLEHLAQAYVDAIIRQGDHPRMMLVGLSFGGLLALEVTARLRERGITVTAIILLDSYISNSGYRSFSKIFSDLHHRGLGKLLQSGARRWQKLKGDAVAEASRKDREHGQKQREKAFNRAGAVFENQLRQYACDALLIKADATNFGFGFRAKRDYGLTQHVQGKLDLDTVSADHVGMMTGDAVIQVYRAIQRYLAKRTSIVQS